MEQDDGKEFFRIARITASLLGQSASCDTCVHKRTSQATNSPSSDCLSPEYKKFSETYTGNGGSEFWIPYHVWNERSNKTGRVPWLANDNVFKYACGGRWHEPR